MNQNKDEITDLGEALVAIIQSPPGTWVDSSGSAWRLDRSQCTLQWFDADDGPTWIEGSLYVLSCSLPIRRIRYGWVPCEREEAHQLPDGTRAYVGKAWKAVRFTGPEGVLDEEVFNWVKWGQLQ